MSGYRITLFADVKLVDDRPPVTQAIIDEVNHMIRLYQEDGDPPLRFNLSAVTPLPPTPGVHHA